VTASLRRALPSDFEGALVLGPTCQDLVHCAPLVHALRSVEQHLMARCMARSIDIARQLLRHPGQGGAGIRGAASPANFEFRPEHDDNTGTDPEPKIWAASPDENTPRGPNQAVRSIPRWHGTEGVPLSWSLHRVMASVWASGVQVRQCEFRRQKKAVFPRGPAPPPPFCVRRGSIYCSSNCPLGQALRRKPLPGFPVRRIPLKHVMERQT
jgi:hypothetical protein